MVKTTNKEAAKNVGRQRVDSIIGDQLDEYADYEPMTYSEDKCKKLDKVNKILKEDPGAQLVMIAVPKGFDITQLNNIKESGDDKEKNLDLRRKLRKIAKTEQKKHITKAKIMKGKSADQCTLDISVNQSVSTKLQSPLPLNNIVSIL